jgi:hypothetical protein
MDVSAFFVSYCETPTLIQLGEGPFAGIALPKLWLSREDRPDAVY